MPDLKEATDDLVSLESARRLTGAGRHSLLARVALGELDAVPIDGRIFLRRSQVERFASERTRRSGERAAVPA